ncbi:copper transporter [Colletotrichum chrysophilum]|uniref:Copper transport protein n=1 Tax=Colletotrichum chrysophilum TaxID=1836956 RepID=A0AAD9EUG9_9PEZI|nr:copper transporter [Colletotrichum chrysophilum]
MDMTEHNHGHSNDGDGSMTMPVVFHTAMSTSLFSETWTPRTTGQYAGTCLTLIIFTIILRALLAFKPRLETTVWADDDTRGRLVVGHDDEETGKEGMPTRSNSKRQRNSDNGMRGIISEANIRLGRAIYEVIIALLGYLLMLAVMSMNVGYFVSILVGVFLGTLGLGGIARDSTFDHCSQ